MALIACVDLDPFLLEMVRRVRPQDHVVAVDVPELGSARRRRYAAVVMSARSARARGLEAGRLAERTVLVTGASDGPAPPGHPGPAVRRPVEATELRQALARLVPTGRWATLRGRWRALRVTTSTDGIFAVARVVAMTAAAVLALTTSTSGPPEALVVALFAWTLLRVWARGTTPGLVAMDGAWAALLIVTGAGTSSPFLLFAAVVATEVGYAFPLRLGVSLVGIATLGGLVPIALRVPAGTASTSDLIGWGVLVPVSSVVGVLAHRLRSEHQDDNLRMLQELHATLDRLSKQAQGVAGTLDVGSVVEKAMAAAREDLGATAGVLLLGDGEVLTVVDAFGLAGEPPRRVVTSPTRRDPGLPQALTSLLPEGALLVAPLDAMGVQRGVLVVVGESSARSLEADLTALATEIAVAIDNARLFEGIQELTIDEERRRLARDLHDGVIQSLVHVRFELDLVGRLVDTDHTGEIERLRDVVGQAVDEVRATVNDLRSVRLSAGLGTALLSVAREYEGSERRVVVDAAPVEALTPEAELQLLRIAQEAISNAVHHGRSTLVYVRLWEDSREVHLQILDDGVGMADALADVARGVGLRAMQERADLLGGVLDLGPGADGGTCIQVDVPVERANA